MTRWDTDNLNAAHTQRELDQEWGGHGVSEMFLLIKRGLYWRPNGKGYTGLKEEAGRYTLEECSVHFPNADSPNQDGTSFIAEDDAPDYASGCCEFIKGKHIHGKIEQLERDLAAEKANSGNAFKKYIECAQQLAAEKALADRLYRDLDIQSIWVSGCLDCEAFRWDADQADAAASTTKDAHDTLATYRKARGL